MAGDWIKIEHTLPDKPEVSRIAEILGIDPDAVIGKLVRFWLWCDQQSVSGNSLGITKSHLDRLVYQPGFSDALIKVDWLLARSGSLEVPRFDRHNGQTAKARSESARRMAKKRGSESDVTQKNEHLRNFPVTKSEARERIREENIAQATAPAIPPVELETAKANSGQHGATPEIAERWWLDRDSVGWLVRGQPVTRWQSDLSAYAARWRSNAAAGQPLRANPQPLPPPDPNKWKRKP